jgi:hypothetical protein
MRVIARPSRRAVGRALGWGALLFLAGQIALGAVIDRAGVAVRDPDYAAKEALLRARRAEHPGRPLFVALGSSRTLQGLDAARLSGRSDGPLVFNFGLPAGGPLRMYVSWRRLLAAGLRPDAVLVEVLPPALTVTGQEKSEVCWDDGARLSVAELAELHPFYARPCRAAKQWAAARGLPCRTYPGLLGRPDDPSSFGFPIDGFGWHGHHLPGLSPEWRAEFHVRTRRSYAAACRDGRFGPAVGALWALLADCRREGVPAACVLMPEGRGFQELYDTRAVCATRRRVEELCRQTDARLIDARRWVADDLFWDGHHLLDDGAAVFSDRLAGEVLPGLAADRSLVATTAAGRDPPIRHSR